LILHVITSISHDALRFLFVFLLGESVQTASHPIPYSSAA
jgi:hypothetical protein